MAKASSISFPLLLRLGDITSFILGFFIAYYLRNYGVFRNYLSEIQPITIYLTALPFAALLLIIVFALFKLYFWQTRVQQESYMGTILKAIVVWLLLIMSGSYLYKYDYSRILLLLTFFLTNLFIILFRYGLKVYEQNLLRKGKGIQRILIVGSGRPGREIARKLKSLDRNRFHIVGFIDENSKGSSDYPVVGILTDIKKLIKKYSINEVYISDPNISHDQILEIVSQCLGLPIIMKIESNVFELISGPLDAKNLSELPILNLSLRQNKIYHISKRLNDIFLSAILLTITFPLWLLIYINITKEDGKPVFIKQKRVGLGRRIFQMYKFRTMVKETHLYANAPHTPYDKRITYIGKFLRKYSLDELPQLLNILKGEMSLVGPRPEMPQIVATYSLWQKNRLRVKPGLTGLWQILGRKDLPLTHNLEYDFYYLLNQSFSLDLKILLKTISVVISSKGAY